MIDREVPYAWKRRGEESAIYACIGRGEQAITYQIHWEKIESLRWPQPLFLTRTV